MNQPCPFCGAEPHWSVRGSGLLQYPQRKAFGCTNPICGIRPKTPWTVMAAEGMEAEAVATWNRRLAAVDTSDIPEVGEEWFAKAKQQRLRRP